MRPFFRLIMRHFFSPHQAYNETFYQKNLQKRHKFPCLQDEEQCKAACSHLSEERKEKYPKTRQDQENRTNETRKMVGISPKTCGIMRQLSHYEADFCL